MVYTIWMHHFGFGAGLVSGLEHVGCDVQPTSDSYYNAQCLRNAVDTYRADYAKAASLAVVTATFPIILFWSILADLYLSRCSGALSKLPTLELISDDDWRTRIEIRRANRASRPTPQNRGRS